MYTYSCFELKPGLCKIVFEGPFGPFRILMVSKRNEHPGPVGASGIHRVSPLKWRIRNTKLIPFLCCAAKPQGEMSIDPLTGLPVLGPFCATLVAALSEAKQWPDKAACSPDRLSCSLAVSNDCADTIWNSHACESRYLPCMHKLLKISVAERMVLLSSEPV